MPPPRLAQLLVTVFVRDPGREFLLGDLEEQFAALAEGRGGWRARRRYWSQALRSIWQARSLRGAQRKSGRPRRRNMWNLWSDLRLGARTAWHSKSYSAIAIATMALAIGANTLLFSIANPLLVRGLPIKDAGSLGWVLESNAVSGELRSGATLPDFLDWRAHFKSLTELAARSIGSATLTGHGDAEHVEIVRATANLSTLWGLRPAAGRLFQPGEDTPGQPLVGVLSHHYWQKAFNGDPAALGRTVFVDGKPVTLVGVMEPELEVYGYARIDLWLPLPLDPAAPRDQRTLRVVGRLAPGATLASAEAELRTLAAAQAREHPDTNLNWEPSVVSTRSAMTGPDTWVLLALLGVVVIFVLLIACANLANLVLARVVRRGHDFAVRQALGASRLQLIRPLLVENLLLGILGGAGGLAIAFAGLRLINATAFDTLLRQIGIDGNVLVFTAVLSLVTPMLFSLGPALGAGRTGTAETLRGTRSSGGRRASRRRNVLVASQVALALSLLVVSGLVLRTVMYYQHVDIGLDVRHLLTFRVDPPSDRYATDAARAQFARDMVRELGAIPGVTAAAVASHLPVFDGDLTQTMTGTRHDGSRDTERPWASCFVVTPDFFKAGGIGLLAGRPFALSDAAGAQPVAILNRMAAEQYFDGIGGALGRAVVLHKRGAPDRPVTIVGVVANTRNAQVSRTSPQVYVAFDQAPVTAVTVLIQSPTPGDRAPDVRSVMRRLDPGVAIASPKTMVQMVDDDTADNAIVNGLFLGFAFLALVLAAGGLYGVISYSVGQRQREIGVRLALGAAPSTIRWMVLGESLRVSGAGIVIGLVLAVLLGHASASVLMGVSPTDPLTFGTVTLLVLTVAVAAVWSPAARAMRVDPARTLRAE